MYSPSSPSKKLDPRIWVDCLWRVNGTVSNMRKSPAGVMH